MGSMRNVLPGKLGPDDVEHVVLLSFKEAHLEVLNNLRLKTEVVSADYVVARMAVAAWEIVCE